MITTDANGIVAEIAYKLSEVIGIYPITPSSSMAEATSNWANAQKTNIFGDIPRIEEMQSEAGAIAVVHGALQAGSLATSFTSSQGLLLMIPSLYKLAGQLVPFVLHVAARTIATHALSIFGDHSDVMAIRQTGCALLCSSSVQETQDFALISHITTLQTRIPFVHFFDGFRTSHEINKIVPLSNSTILEMLPQNAINEFRARKMDPENPNIRGTSANPDTFFQSREAINPFYDSVYSHVEQTMNKFGEITGRNYKPYEFYGDKNAETILILMGSAIGTCQEIVDYLNNKNEKVGILKVRLYRPFYAQHFLNAIPKSVKKIAVLDRTKEPGSQGEPLFLDVLTAFSEAFSNQTRDFLPKIIGGRYGLSSKEFTPNDVLAIFDELKKAVPKRRFTSGIIDDISFLSLQKSTEKFENPIKMEALFYGLGSDGTVSATKNNIKIIGNSAHFYVQGYFVYDSKKAGGLTVSHLRVSEKPIHSSYLIKKADFIACHQDQFIDKYPILEKLKPNGIFLLNSPYSKDEIWNRLPQEVQQELTQKKAKFFIINAAKIARNCKLGARINTVMQMAFFHLANIYPHDLILSELQQAISKSYHNKGEEIIARNWQALSETLVEIHEIPIQKINLTSKNRPLIVPKNAPEFVQNVTASMIAGFGDLLPVSAFPPDGIWPSGTTKWEKRNIAEEIPIWKANLCTQCNHCVVACPHAAIRAKIVTPDLMENAPKTLQSLEVKAKDLRGQNYILQVAPEDCTGCNLCVEICPARDRNNLEIKAINMESRIQNLKTEKENFEFFMHLPDRKIESLERIDVRTSQLISPLFEFSGACAGCGETPYIKLLTQLFGERLLIANATGCSSIYGGNLPTSPYTKTKEGCGPAWANSLFEDNAEFGLGIKLSQNQHKMRVLRLLDELADKIPPEITNNLKNDEISIAEKRNFVQKLREFLPQIHSEKAKELLRDVNHFIEKSVWIIGGDGWAYDIGFGGLDHVMSLNENVNVLVLDTQCYSNTGGQQSKATPLGAIAKFAESGKQKMRKDLGVNLMMYKHIFVAQIALGAQLNQTIKAIQEAESYPGPSIIIAYSPCEEHGYDLAFSHEQMKLLTKTGFWPLYRFDPRNQQLGKPILSLDSRKPDVSLLESTIYNEQRFKLLRAENETNAKNIIEKMQLEITNRYHFLELFSNENEK